MYDPIRDKDYVARRIEQFQLEMLAMREADLELIRELEAQAAEQARLAAVDQRIEELEEQLLEEEVAGHDAIGHPVSLEASAVPPGVSSHFVPDGGVDDFGTPTGEMVPDDE